MPGCRTRLPKAARPFFQIWTLIFEVMTVAHILNVHRQLIRFLLIIRHSLRCILVLEPVLGFEQRVMRIDNVVAVAGIIVSELPVAFVLKSIGFADGHLAAGVPVQPFVDRLFDRAKMFDDRNGPDVKLPKMNPR